MEVNQIVSFVGAIGIGGLLGVILQSYFNQRLNDKRMLFDARVKAYSGLTGRIFNLFLEPDVTSLKEDALIFAKINQLFSEAMLMASHDLSEKLGEYKPKVYEFHIALDKKDEERQKGLHGQLIKLAGNIYDLMRKYLHVDKRTSFSNLQF